MLWGWIRVMERGADPVKVMNRIEQLARRFREDALCLPDPAGDVAEAFKVWPYLAQSRVVRRSGDAP
jgi:hypothetical protein